MPEQARDEDSVCTFECKPDFNDLGWATLQNLGVEAPTPGPDRAKLRALRKFLRLKVVKGTAYVNPAFLVTAAHPTREFIRQARHAQQSWLKRLKDGYQVCGIFKRAMRRTREIHPLLVQMEFTGLLFIRGKHIHPQRWPRGEPVRNESVDLTGKVFGRLTARSRLPGARWLCDCECDKIKVVRSCHLQSGKTKSCGCWQREINEGRQRRKRRRAFLYSGEIM